jgi:hypothetical protein
MVQGVVLTPSGRFRTEQTDSNDWQWPYPLDSVRDSPSPLVATGLNADEYTGRDELPNDPAQVDVTKVRETSRNLAHLVRYPLRLTGKTSDA